MDMREALQKILKLAESHQPSMAGPVLFDVEQIAKVALQSQPAMGSGAEPVAYRWKLHLLEVQQGWCITEEPPTSSDVCEPLYIHPAPTAQDSGKQFEPGTLGFLLEYIGQGEPDCIDCDDYEFYAEDDHGRSGTYSHSITDLCRKAAEALRAQDSKVPGRMTTRNAKAMLEKYAVEADGADTSLFSMGWNECRKAMLSAAPSLAERPDHAEQPLAMVAEEPKGNPHDGLVFVGYTNGAQILYANDPNFGGEGQFYKDTAHDSVIPLYMLKTHWHRLESTTGGDVTLDMIKSLQRPQPPGGE